MAGCVVLQFVLFFGAAHETPAQVRSGLHGLELTVQKGHAADASAYTISGDGRYVMTGGRDKEAILWSSASGLILRRFSGHTMNVVAVDISPDGKYAVTGSLDATARLWRISDGQQLRTFENPRKDRVGWSNEVTQVAFSPDATVVAVVFAVDTNPAPVNTRTHTSFICFYRISNGELISVKEQDDSFIEKFEFLPDGRYLTERRTDDWQHMVDIWNADGLVSDYDGVDAAFSPDRSLLATVEDSGAVTIRDAVTGALRRGWTTDIREPKAITFATDKSVAIRDRKGTITAWSIESGEAIPSDAKFHDLLFSKRSKDKRVAVAMIGKVPTVLNADNGAAIRILAGAKPHVPNAAGFSRDGSLIFNDSQEGRVDLWVPAGERVHRTIDTGAASTSVALTGDNQFMLVGHRDQSASLWDTSNGELRWRFVKYQPGELDTTSKKWFDDYGTTAVAISNSGRFALVGSGESLHGLPGNSVAMLLDMRTGSVVERFEGSIQGVTAVAFSSDDEMIALGGPGGVQLYARKTAELVRDLAVPQNPEYKNEIRSLAFSRDGKTLVAGGNGNSINVWDLASNDNGKQIYLETTNPGYFVPVVSLQFLPDGRIAIGTSRGIYLWNLQANVAPTRLSEQQSGVNAVALSADGKIMLTSGVDGAIVLRESGNASEICRIVTLEDGSWVVVRPDGRFDTSQRLDDVKGLHWVLSGDVPEALPLDIFVRQYYEPNLLRRLIDCTTKGGNSCDTGFQKLPSIADINRKQPIVRPSTAR